MLARVFWYGLVSTAFARRPPFHSADVCPSFRPFHGFPIRVRVSCRFCKPRSPATTPVNIALRLTLLFRVLIRTGCACDDTLRPQAYSLLVLLMRLPVYHSWPPLRHSLVGGSSIITIPTCVICRVLVGTGRSCYETLRPLAYSLLAELIHHVRIDLSLQQLSRIIYLFSKNVHDHSLPLSVQTTCVRLMLNLVRSPFQGFRV
jgi:hypothetical protein